MLIVDSRPLSGLFIYATRRSLLFSVTNVMCVSRHDDEIWHQIDDIMFDSGSLRVQAGP